MERKIICSPPQTRVAMRAPEIKRAVETKIDAAIDGSFEGYASVFYLRDLGNDIVMPGAFSESVLIRGRRGVKMLWQHDAAQPVGSWSYIGEDHKGLKVRGQLNLQVAKAREIHSLMREGAVDGLSIGFRTKRAERDAKSGVRRLYNLDLWEISLVTFPMLPQARVDAVKRGTYCSDGIMSGSNPAYLVRKLRRTASLMR